MTRPAFDPNADDDKAGDGPVKRYRCRFPCSARNCPMPGTMDHDLKTDLGVCAWHWGEQPHSWPSITQHLIDWDCVARAINEGRRALIHPDMCANARALDAVMRAQAGYLAVQAPDWPELQPQADEHLWHWVRRLEGFLVARVKGLPFPERPTT